jgi:hypothetical protein
MRYRKEHAKMKTSHSDSRFQLCKECFSLVSSLSVPPFPLEYTKTDWTSKTMACHSPFTTGQSRVAWFVIQIFVDFSEVT